MVKPMIVYRNVPVFIEWPTNFYLLFQAPYMFLLGTLFVPTTYYLSILFDSIALTLQKPSNLIH